jgi:hypothetical protein
MSLTHSDSIVNIAPAFIKAQAKFPSIIRDQENPEFGNGYTSLGELRKRTRKPLERNGLGILQPPTALDMEKDTVTISTMLVHSSGEWMKAEFEMPIVEEDWAQGKVTGQVLASAVTYACRIALKAFLSIAEKDDDGNLASGRGAETHGKDKVPSARWHEENVSGTVLEVVAKGKTDSYLRMKGVAARIWIHDSGILALLRNATGDEAELECRIQNDEQDPLYFVKRVLKLRNYDFTNVTDISGPFKASLEKVSKHNFAKREESEPLKPESA